jgi:hypothetical protein
MSMCLSSSRSLAAPGRGLGGVALAAPWWRSLVGSALSSARAVGGCGPRLGRSPARRSSPASVAPAAAARFAAAWASWCAARSPCGGSPAAAARCWGVSVPVCVPPGARSLAAPPPSGLPAPVWVARA